MDRAALSEAPETAPFFDEAFLKTLPPVARRLYEERNARPRVLGIPEGVGIGRFLADVVELPTGRVKKQVYNHELTMLTRNRPTIPSSGPGYVHGIIEEGERFTVRDPRTGIVVQDTTGVMEATRSRWKADPRMQPGREVLVYTDTPSDNPMDRSLQAVELLDVGRTYHASGVLEIER